MPTDTKVLRIPVRPQNISASSQWLSGEGAGSWFSLENTFGKIIVSRYSPEGKLECRGEFLEGESGKLKWDEEFSFTYLSHCGKLTLLQNNYHHTLILKEKL